jgi:hypothetical protein
MFQVHDHPGEAVEAAQIVRNGGQRRHDDCLVERRQGHRQEGTTEHSKHFVVAARGSRGGDIGADGQGSAVYVPTFPNSPY